MQATLAYGHRSSVTTSLDEAALDFAANLARAPVSFKGRATNPYLLRQMLFALHRVVIGDFRWMDEAEWAWVLDPVITVHPDQLFFEAFSTDESCYARLSCPLHAFEAEGPVSYGTTNIDFTFGLRSALEGMRTSQRTMFGVGAEGFAVETAGDGSQTHFERKVDIPEGWLRGFLQVQSALTMHPFMFEVRPTDLLAIIAFFEDNKPPGPPHGLRYELKPDEPIRVVLEPWEKEFILRDTHYKGYERTVRVWGRRRLQLLQHVLPYAHKVTIAVLGRGLPHFYFCTCGEHQFLLGLSGWTANDWSKGSSFELLAPQDRPEPQVVERIHARLSEDLFGVRTQLAAEDDIPRAQVEHALFELCRAGRVMFDPTTGFYRLRELFAEPLDTEALFPTASRLRKAQELLDAEAVELEHIAAPETPENWRRETKATGTVEDAGQYSITVAVDTEGRLRFGTCECPFFQANIMSRGPCEHILAGRLALDRHLKQTEQPDTIVGEELEN